MQDGAKETIMVLSGKGGVGKSTVSTQLASSFLSLDYSVGILDLDLCGPSIPKMLGVETEDVLSTKDGKWMPVTVPTVEKLYVLSIAFFLESKNDAVIWRGPKKNAMIKQLLTNVQWNVDYLVIDTPPGTSDEHISVMENLKQWNVKGAVLVTTPQMLSIDDVTRELTFCRKTGINVLGIIENMSGFVCPYCLECNKILASDGGEKLAEKYGILFFGKIPIEPALAKCLEQGKLFIKNNPLSPLNAIYRNIARRISCDEMDISSLKVLN